MAQCSFLNGIAADTFFIMAQYSYLTGITADTFIFMAQCSYLTGITVDTFCVMAQCSYLTSITADTFNPYMTVPRSINIILTWNDSEGYDYLICSRCYAFLLYFTLRFRVFHNEACVVNGTR
jgi:hypothetical protein